MRVELEDPRPARHYRDLCDHDRVEAMTLGDRVAVMQEGVVQQVGEPLDVYNAPANRFVAGEAYEFAST